MKKILAAAALGAALIGGSLASAGMAAAEDYSYEYGYHEGTYNYYRDQFNGHNAKQICRSAIDLQLKVLGIWWEGDFTYPEAMRGCIDALNAS